MVKDMAAVVAAASQSRGIGYQGQMVRTFTCRVLQSLSTVIHSFSSAAFLILFFIHLHSRDSLGDSHKTWRISKR
jgi:hypothetical protein